MQLFGVLEEPRRLLEGDIAAKFLAAVLAQPKAKKLLSTDHFSVDGTLIEAWASIKSKSRRARPRLRGRDRVGWAFTFAAAAYNWCGCRSDMTAPAGAN